MSDTHSTKARAEKRHVSIDLILIHSWKKEQCSIRLFGSISPTAVSAQSTTSIQGKKGFNFTGSRRRSQYFLISPTGHICKPRTLKNNSKMQSGCHI